MAIPIEIWHAAVRLLAQHGTFAEHHVLYRMREMCRREDLEAFAVWGKILAAMNELRRTDRRDGESTN